jgi:hypothetical protein
VSPSDTASRDARSNSIRIPAEFSTDFREEAGGSTMSSIVADLYAAISILDSENQSDLAGRLHALTLEIRERAAIVRARQYS